MKLIPNVCSTGEEFAEYLDALDRNYFVGCLDVGHCGIIGQNAADMIYTLGKDRLNALHIHDNDHVNDLHTLPMTQSIDFKSIMKALKDIGYEGELTLEADNFLKGFPKDLLPEASLFMLKTAKQLIKMYEEA
jgi:L-ribulose-5-phosphate 3-epimerase